MMKCLYVGCQTAGESQDSFHKVVGSTGRDGNPLYICAEHFQKLKSSKTPSLVTCKKPVCKPSTYAGKGNEQNEKTQDAAAKEKESLEQKRDFQPPLRRNQNDTKEKKYNSEVNVAVVGFTHGPSVNVTLPFSTRRKNELGEGSRKVSDVGKYNLGKRVDSPKGVIQVEDKMKDLKTVRIGDILEPTRSASRPSILRRKTEPSKHIVELVVAEVGETNYNQKVKPATKVQHNPPVSRQTLASPFNNCEIGEPITKIVDDIGEDGNEPIQRERRLVIVEEEEEGKLVPKLKTLQRIHGVFPSIIRRNPGNLEHDYARSNEQMACGDKKVIHVGNPGTRDSQFTKARIVTKKEIVPTNKDIQEVSNERCIVVEEEEENMVPKLKTSVLRRTHGVIPAIIRRKSGKVEGGTARNNQTACGDKKGETHSGVETNKRRAMELELEVKNVSVEGKKNNKSYQTKYASIRTYTTNKLRSAENESLINRSKAINYVNAEIVDLNSRENSWKQCIDYENNINWQIIDEKSSLCSLIHNMEYDEDAVEEITIDSQFGLQTPLHPIIPPQRRNCSATGCTSSYPEVRLNRFPFDPDRIKIWCDIACQGKEKHSMGGYLCVRHFRTKDFTRPDRRRLLRRANPSYPTGPLNPITKDYSPFEDTEPVRCSALNCGLSLESNPDVVFAPFPPESDLRYRDWCRIAGDVENPRYLCGRHFDVTQFCDFKRQYLEHRPVPSYKTGPLNPLTEDYSPVEEDTFGSPPASPDVDQTLGIPEDDSQTGQQNRNSRTSQNLHIESLGSIISQNDNITGAYNVSSIAVANNSNNGGLIVTIPNNTGDDNDEVSTAHRQCDAVGCPSTNKSNPQIKFFRFPGRNSSSPVLEKRRQLWIELVGGTKTGQARYLCQYHFPADAYFGPTRSLVRNANPLFPYGPLNPVTNDYCPIGAEQRSLNSRNLMLSRCCVDGCSTYSNSLFSFPMHDREAYDEWTKRIGVFKYFSEQHIRTKLGICPKHFSSCCTIVDEEKNTIRLKFGALPTINIPCFKGTPSILNSFVQKRSLSSDETEELKKLSESDQVFFKLGQVFDKNTNQQAYSELKRRADDENTAPNKKSKEDDDHSKRLVLMPIQDANGQQSFVYVDFGSLEKYPTVSGQNYLEAKSQIRSVKEPKTAVSSASLEKGLGKPGDFTLVKKRLCTLWSPDKLNKEAAATHKFNKTKISPFPQEKRKCCKYVGNVLKSAKQMYEEFSSGIQEDNIGNEVDIDIVELPEQSNSKQPVVVPTEKTDNTETALLKVFGACEASDDNVFTCFVDPSKIPDHEEENNVHSYCSSNSLNVIRSAAELCEFNDLKIKQLERLIETGEETSSELEQILIKHLSSVMCITGVDFLKKCFDQVLKEAILKKKEKDKLSKCPNYKHEPPIMYSGETKQLAVALQTFSGKAYHAMTQLIDLPHQSVVRDWTSHQNGDPGFSNRAFKILQEEAHKKETVTVCLGVEEVPLKQDVSWDGLRSFGYTDLGYGAIDYDCIPEATRAVVFFAIALNRTWRIPLGYCLADNLSASVRANLVIQYLYQIGETGARCIALVCNHSLVSHDMLVELGAISEEYYSPQTGSFPHPSTRGDRVHCFVDIHQLTKSIYTLWAEKKVFTFKNKDRIEWSHMNRMHEFIQSDEKFPNTGLENVFKDLMDLKSLIKRDPRSSHKYNLLVLGLLKQLNLEGFENVAGTEVFLERLNSVIDLFTSCNSFDTRDRQALTKKNLFPVTQKLNNLIFYLNNLTYENGTKILMSERKLPLLLLFSNITSLKAMVKKVFYGDKYKVNEIRTESFTLDGTQQTLLEMTDGKKALLTPLEFKEAFFNFVENMKLEPSSRLGVRQHIEKTTSNLVERSLGFSNVFSYQFSPVSTICENIHEFFTENVIDNWFQVTHCTDCSQLVQKELLSFRKHNSKGNVIEDIRRMLRIAETILAELDEIPINACNTWFDKLANKTLNSLTSFEGFKTYSHLFNSKPFGEVTHFTVMVKEMLRIFLRLRSCFLSREEKIRIRPFRNFSLRFALGRSWA